MISRPVALHDIQCIESFVTSCMVKSRVRFPEHEREEMHAEGIALLYELAERYDPSKEKKSSRVDHVCNGPRCCVPSFAGYASFLLPRRMQSAWHALHPEHLSRRETDGRRVYEYAAAPISLHSDDAPAIIATTVLHALPEDDHSNATGGYQAPNTIASALARMPVWDRLVAAPVVRLVEEGRGVDEIASTLRLRRGQVSSTIGAVGTAIYQVTREAT